MRGQIITGAEWIIRGAESDNKKVRKDIITFIVELVCCTATVDSNNNVLWKIVGVEWKVFPC